MLLLLGIHKKPIASFLNRYLLTVTLCYSLIATLSGFNLIYGALKPIPVSINILFI